MLHSMTISQIHVDQFETFNLCYWAKCHSGVIWGQEAGRVRVVPTTQWL